MKEYELTQRQLIAWQFLTDLKDRHVLYGGSKGGGKSFLGCLWVLFWCDWLISYFGLEPSENPLPVGFMGRKQSVDFDKTTLETWKKVIPPTAYEIREQKKEIIIRKTVKVFYGGLDSQETINKFNSAELAFCFIDQAEETAIGDVDVLFASLRLTVDGKTPPYKTLLTANPAQCWLKDRFIIMPDERHVYVQALPSDNPHLPANYIDTLKEAFHYDQAKLNAYLFGSWDDIGGVDDLMYMSDVQACFESPIVRFYNHRVISCDVARFGDDLTVIYAWENECPKQREVLAKKDLMSIVGRLLYWEQLMNHDVLFVIDDSGLGGGVTDRLRELGKNVLAVNFGEKPSEPDRYFNKRAEMYCKARDTIIERQVKIPKEYVALHGELCGVKYNIRSDGRCEIEAKEKTKERIGKSPDEADAFVMGLEGLRWLNTSEGQAEFKIKWKEVKPAWVKDREDESFNRELAGNGMGAYT